MSTNTNEFRLRSIEEFDAYFVQNVRVTKAPPPKPVSKPAGSLIPELNKNTFEIKGENTAPSVAPPVQSIPVTPPARQTETAAPRPLVPIGSGQATLPPEQITFPGISVSKENADYIPPKEEDFEADAVKEKKSGKGGFLALKISSIVLLAATIFVFLAGCFVAIFLNNDGTQIAGYSLNSQLRDTTFLTDKGEITIAKGALVASKELTASEYEKNMMIAVSAEDQNGEKCCEIYSVSNVTPIDKDTVTLDLIIPDSGEIGGQTTSDNCYGLVKYYIPVIGGAIAFTTSSVINTVLVCALCILLAAFWCLLVILADKKLKAIKEDK